MANRSETKGNPVKLPSGVGEQEAISLAIELRADLLLVDDKQARNCAIALGVNVTGTLGILDVAARKGFIKFADAIDALKRTNFHVSEELLDMLLRNRKQGE